jgi:peptidoglycan/xylan/chitin deacetylase (PgdA/CDA1 family)
MRTVLTYHSLDDSGSPISISPAVFEWHLSWLATSGVTVTTIEGLLAMPDEGHGVAITFDDGFQNFFEMGWPRLRAYGWGATLFVVTDHVGRTNDWGGRAHPGIPRLPLLGWDLLGRLAEAGVQLGAHTRTHPDLTRLDPAAAAEEMEQSSHEIVRHTGLSPHAVAYPYGRVNASVVALAASRFRWGVTTELRGLERTDSSMLLPRLDMFYFQQPGRLDAWGSRKFRSHLRRCAVTRRIGASLRAARGAFRSPGNARSPW